MARIRTIKPEFFTSLTIAQLTVEQRLTFIGLWTHADDAGRFVADGRLVKAALWPLDDRTAEDVEADLEALMENSLIAHYVVDGRRYAQVCGWADHQRINRPTPSKLPDPKGALTSENEPSRTPHGALMEGSPPERNREQGKENPPQPPPSTPSPPSGEAARGGDAARSTATANPDDGPAARALEQLLASLPPDLGEQPIDDRDRLRLLGILQRRLAEGWTAVDLRASLGSWSGIRHVARAMGSRLEQLGNVAPPAAVHARREAAARAADERKAAETAADVAERARRQELLDALTPAERRAVARRAWEAIPDVVRPPAPDLAIPAVAAMARSIVAGDLDADEQPAAAEGGAA